MGLIVVKRDDKRHRDILSRIQMGLQVTGNLLRKGYNNNRSSNWGTLGGKGKLVDFTTLIKFTTVLCFPMPFFHVQ